jgi:hypothetical protein
VDGLDLEVGTGGCFGGLGSSGAVTGNLVVPLAWLPIVFVVALKSLKEQ